MRVSWFFLLGIGSFGVGCATRPGADATVIVKEYEAQSGGARHCYEQALKEDPALQGKVTLKWTVNDKGIVTKSSIAETDIPNLQFSQCVLTHLKSIQFSKAKRFTKAMIEYTMRFHKVKQSN